MDQHASPTPAATEPLLAGQAALVTGAGRGIGRAIALRLAASGVRVCLTARSEDELDSAVKEVERDGGEAIAVRCDLTDADRVEELVATASRELGGLGLLVNNAGGAHRIRRLERLDSDDFEIGTRLNYESVYRTMHAAAPHLFAAAPRAAVLNVISVASERGLAGMSYYSGAKAAVQGFSRAAAREWGSRGVRVNCLAPGWIATELARPLMADEEFVASTLPQIALGRWGEPEEVADVALFLLSDRARYITGTTIVVDGGLLA